MHTVKEVKQLFIDKGYIPLFDEYKRNDQKLLASINDYKVLTTFRDFSKGKPPRIFAISNPYTIENIKLFLQRNNNNIELTSKEYIKARIPLSFKCKICDHEWSTNFFNIQKSCNCPNCSYQKLKLNFEDIKIKMNKINNNIEILEENYINARTPMLCKCKIDNTLWKSRWDDLRKGCGCPTCANERQSGLFGNLILQERNKEDWENINSKLYILYCWNDEENFYKIGVTTHDVKQRYLRKSSLPYNYEILREIEFNLYDVSKIEHLLKKINNKNKYKPKLKFKGYTECFYCLSFEYSGITKEEKDLISKFRLTPTEYNNLSLVATPNKYLRLN